MERQKNVISGKWVQALPLFDAVANVTVALLLGFFFTIMLITGVVYPIGSVEQQLLRSWNIESVFIQIVSLEYVLPLLAAIPITYRLARKFNVLYMLTSSSMYIAAAVFAYSLMSFLDAPVVVQNLIMYPIIGFFIGQAIGKAIALDRGNHEDLRMVNTLCVALELAGSLFVGFQLAMYIVTGYVYPQYPADQELLRSWGIESVFAQIVLLEYLISILVAVPITHRLVGRFRSWFLVSTLLVLPSFALVSSLMGFSGGPIVMQRMIVFPITGWIIGQTIGKIIALSANWRSRPDLSVKAQVSYPHA